MDRYPESSYFGIALERRVSKTQRPRGVAFFSFPHRARPNPRDRLSKLHVFFWGQWPASTLTLLAPRRTLHAAGCLGTLHLHSSTSRSSVFPVSSRGVILKMIFTSDAASGLEHLGPWNDAS